MILLNKPTSYVGGDETVTDVIYTETGFPELLKHLDQSNFHFARSTGVVALISGIMTW